LKRDPNWKPRAYEKEDDPIRAWWEYEAIGILQPGEKSTRFSVKIDIQIKILIAE